MTGRGLALAAWSVAVMLAAGCGSDTVTAPTTATSPVTVTWTGLISPGGTASRSLTAAQAGTITVTLSTTDVPLGLGIGVPRVANGGCRLTVSQVADSGATLAIPADQGDYCVQLFDDGRVVRQAAFSVQLVYP